LTSCPGISVSEKTSSETVRKGSRVTPLESPYLVL
jgi:hypothetical protein